MRHSTTADIYSVIAALATMTVLSVLLGQAALCCPVYIHYAEITLFVGFGLKLLYEASRMPAQSCDAEVVKEATAAVDKTELKLSTQQVQMAICLEAFVLTFWQRGDRTQIATITLAASKKSSRSDNRCHPWTRNCAMIAVLEGECWRAYVRAHAHFSGVPFVFGIVACLGA